MEERNLIPQDDEDDTIIESADVVERIDAKELHNLPAVSLSNRAIEPFAGIIHHPKGVEMVERIAKALESLRTLAIKSTRPEDWILMKEKGEDGSISAFPGASAALSIGAIFGVQIIDPSPVTIREELVGDKKLRVAECSADAYGRVTNMLVKGVTARKIESERFTGRDQGDVGLIDLMQSARTALDRKCVCLVSGMKSVPVSVLAEAWEMKVEEVINLARRGSGFGTSAERRAARAAEKGAAPATDRISDGQRRMLWGKAFGRVEALKIASTDEGTKAAAARIINALCDRFEIEKIEELEQGKLEEAVQTIGRYTE